jgi:hypothetical protein
MSAALVSRTLVIVPTYNEADNIAILVTAIFQATPAIDILCWLSLRRSAYRVH